METENKKLELHSMSMAADNKGLVKEGKTAKIEEVDENKMEVVFLPAFDLDINKVSPEVARELKSKKNTRITEGAIARRTAKAQEGREI